MKRSHIFVTLFATFCLSACGTAYQQPAAKPIVDFSAIPAEKRASFNTAVKECQALQQKAMPVSFLEAFGSSDVKRDEKMREEKAAMIVRNCLNGRGYAVLY